MRRIQDLLQDSHKVWFYLKDKNTEELFVEEPHKLGAKYLNGNPITIESCSSIMAVNSDLTVACLMIIIWNASFMPSFADRYVGDVTKILKVDYARYIAGDPDFICQRSEFTPIA